MHIFKIENFQSQNSLNFQAMKPNQFKGIDYAVVRKFKAPVEKFISAQDLQIWAEDLLKRTYKVEYKSFSYSAEIERKFAINRWKEFIDSKLNEWSAAKCLLIFTSMMKNLRFNNEEVPPLIKEDILADSISQLESKLVENKDYQFNFNKIYKQKLRKFYLKDLPTNYTGWVKMLPRRLDANNYESNVELLKLLSNKNWCTKNEAPAKSFLENDEMHIYLEKGFPKLAIRISGSEIQEVQGEKNNSVIPAKYLGELDSYLEGTNYFLSDEMEFMLELSRVMD